MTVSPDRADAQRRLVTELLRLSPVLGEIGSRFAHAGYALHLVGGSVRDALIGRGSDDLDLATDARPEQIMKLVGERPTWTTGIAFGTVGAQYGEHRLEITTYRADRYDRVSRRPEVVYGESLADDLSRRDFTFNAMAFSLHDQVFTDPHGGLADLLARRLRTPGRPGDSFADDPLRMLRAARFVSQLGVTPAPEVLAAIIAMAGELARISVERIQAELSKLLLGEHPRAGLELMVDTGLAVAVLPELPALRLEIDEHHQHKDVYAHSLTVLDQAIALEDDGPDLVLRLAALLHDIGKPATRRHEPHGRVSFHHHEVVGDRMVRERLRALRYPNDVVKAVGQLTFLHLRFHGYGRGEWTDSAVRRYAVDAGALLARLHKLVRSDCTTRNQRRARALSTSYDALEQRIVELQAREDLAAVRPDLDGNAIMELLGIPPGREVGLAWQHLKALRLDRGPLSREQAEAELLSWAAEHLPLGR